MENIKVLYIDDEKDNLNAFKSSFRRVFDIYLATNAFEGLEILKNHHIEVIIADQKMPEMTGVEFFESIIKEFPNPIRILLTGYADINAVKDAINKGEVYRYINKPWDEYEIKLTIENAYQLYQLREHNNKLQNKYQKIFAESTDAIMLFDTSWRLIDYNKATLKLFDDKDLQFNLTFFNDLFKCKPEGKSIIDIFSKKAEINNYECKLELNGAIKNCLISANVISDYYGENITYQTIIRDITDKKNIDQLLLKNTIKAQESERTRISQDLHDGLGQSLVGIKFQLEQLKKEVKTQQQEKLNNLSDVLSLTIQQLRQICYDILPPALSDHGLKKAIFQLCDNSSKEKIKINCKYSDKIPELDKELEISIYRITQEFISNSIKHAQCSIIDISIDCNSNHLFLLLKDNGKGFDFKTTKKGLGINNMVSRVESFDGSINFFDGENNKGTICYIDIPLKKQKYSNKEDDDNDEYISKINTTTHFIGLRKDNIIITKQRNDWNGTIQLQHAVENTIAMENFLKSSPKPILHFLPKGYINNQAMEYYGANPPLSVACAIITKSFLQQKMAEMLLEKKTGNVPTQIFNEESLAINWINEITHKKLN